MAKVFDIHLLKLLKETYFSDETKRIVLEKGETLLEQDQENFRLYLILEGSLVGYLHSESGQKDEIFRSRKDMFVGVHSFFSKSYSSYAQVQAIGKCVLAYIDDRDFSDSEKKIISADFVPVLVNELSSRQLLSQRVMQEKEIAMKKLFQTEKMATLGQMAAGLAHELNNAVGVLQGNADWISGEILSFMKMAEGDNLSQYFELGVEKGSYLSSSETREARKKLEKKYKFKTTTARKLAKLGIDPGKMFQESGLEFISDEADKIYGMWELGVAIHDILLASNHAKHVVNSVKQLAVSNQDRVAVNVNESIQESLTLLKSLVRQVEVKEDFGELIHIEAHRGELVQIWVNIIKNACESMIQAKINNPLLSLETRMQQNNMLIRISNNGPGIPEGLLSTIFQPNVTTKKDGLSFGLGLGLSIVQRLVDSYGGKILVNSKDEITIFSIILPTSIDNGKD